MSFTIDQGFDLLFLSGENADGANYDGRRWFRRPGSSDIDGTPLKEVEDAQDLLAGRIKASGGRWSRTADVKRPPKFDPERHVPPRMPYDVFAFASYLVEQAGIYHHLQPSKLSIAGPVAAAPSSGSPRHVAITQPEREFVAATAKAWSELPRPSDNMNDFAQLLNETATWEALEPLFESWWIVMGACGSESILSRPTLKGAPVVPKWWRHAWRLMAIADEAASKTAFQFDPLEMAKFASGEPANLRWFEGEVMMEHVLRLRSDVGPNSGGASPQEFFDITSLSVANPAVVNVLPKVRTAAVGCTLRSLSHHLALLPAAGIVKGRWTPNYVRPRPVGVNMPDGVMNLVLVPLPYSLGARSFAQAMVEDASGGSPNAVPRFGYFDVEQDWIDGVDDKAITGFLDAVIASAVEQSPAIHGFVFPELALDYETFTLARDHIRQKLPGIEIFVAGVSSNREGEKGNFVAASIFPGDPSAKPAEFRETVREKHHRWKLDRSQLAAYGLTGVLSPEIAWWENIALQSRQVDFTVIRRDSVLAAMICEDLARVDPCQQILRAVGPNLVVALLMDAPQVASRWPARYATVLAEDPGCAVLTLTSRGLMTLQHRLGTHRSNGDDRVIAMWRDDGASRPIELKCPYDAQAVLLTIVEQSAKDVALDGRPDGTAMAWRYVGAVPLRLPNPSAHDIILGPEDMACR